MVLPNEHPWVKQAQCARTSILGKLSQDRAAQHVGEYRQALNALKKDYLTGYIGLHSKARLGVAKKTRPRLHYARIPDWASAPWLASR